MATICPEFQKLVRGSTEEEIRLRINLRRPRTADYAERNNEHIMQMAT